MKKESNKSIMSKVEEYMKLPYTKMVKKIVDESGTYYICEVLELEGCHTVGDTIVEVEENIQEAIQGYLYVKVEYGDEIPKPTSAEDYSGKFVLRLPRKLHQRLAIEAKQQNISLNQYALYKLAK